MPHNRRVLGGALSEFVRDGLEGLWLMDVERRNLARYSEAFDGGAWSATAGGTGTAPIVTAAAGVDPLGNDNATRLQLDKGAGTSSSDLSQLSSGTFYHPGGTATLSLWAKTYDGSTKTVRISLSGAADDLSHEVGGEWTRISTITTLSAGDFQFRISLRGGYGTSDTADLLIYGAQHNVGSTALPYIPTTNKQAAYDYSGNGRHLTRGSTGSAFICPVGEKHLSLPGSASDYAFAEDSADLSVLGDIDLRAELRLDSWTSPGATFTIISKEGGTSSRSYRLGLDNSGVRFLVSDDGSNFDYAVSTAQPSFGDDERGWLRAAYDSSVPEVVFYTSTDGVTWTQLGAAVALTITSIFDSTSRLYVGRYGGGSQPVDGLIYRAQVHDGIDGTLVADFYPDRDAHGDVTRFTSSATGEVWTVNQASASDTNDPTWTGEGFDFGGVDDYGDTGVSVVSGSHSMFIVTDLESNTGDAMASGASAGDVLIQADAGEDLKVHVWNDAGSVFDIVYSGNSIVGSPHFLAQTCDGDTLVGYLDGVAVVDEALSGTFTTESGNIALFDRGPGGGSNGAGLGLAAGIYSRALSRAEVQQNYRAAKALLAERDVSI